MPGPVAAWAAGAYAGATLGGGFTAALAISASTAAVYAGAYAVTAIALSAGLAKASAAMAGRPKLGTGMQSRRVTIRSSTEYRTILYGAGRTGGVLVYANTAGTKNEFMDFVIALAGHQIDAITDVWFDDDKIVEADINSGNAAGGAVGGTGKFKPVSGSPIAYVYKYLGTDTQAASSTLTTDYTEWTADHRLRGCAYVHIRLRRAGTTWEQGPPGNFTFGYRGAKVYDPRLDTTAGGSGAHRVADPSTWAYSNNWALCVADYLIGGALTNSATRVNWRGFGADPADVNWPSVITAANICAESVTIPGSTTQARYTCDGALSTGDVPADNLERLLTAGLGQLTYASDGYRLYAGAYVTPTLAITEADLCGDIACTSDTPRADRYNAVKGVRWDLETGQEVEFLPRTSATYETEDGAQLFREIELPFTLNEYRAQRIAQIILRRSREQETLVMHCNPGALRVAVWETVSVTIAELGISSKVYRCLSRQEHEDDSVILTLREETSATYADPLVADYGALSPATPDPTPDDALDAPTNLVATNVQGGILFTITPDPANGTDVIYELFEHTSSTPFASSTLIWSGAATSFVWGVTDTTVRYYWIRARRGAALSATYPETTGLSGQALESGVPPIPDPFFQHSTANNDYWAWGTDTGVSIALTGGVVGGVLSFTGNSTAKSAYSKRTPDWPVVTGQQFNLYIRFRRTGALGGTDEIAIGGSVSNSQKPNGNSSAGMGGLTITGLNAMTVNEWQEANYVVDVANLPKNQAQLKFGYFYVYMPAACTSGTIEVDALVATPI